MKGKVILAVDDYNALLIERNRLKSAIKIQSRWGDEVEVSLDITLIKDIVAEKFAASTFAAEGYVLKTSENMYPPAAVIATKPIADEE